MRHPTIFKHISDSGPQEKRRLLKGTTSLPPDVLRDASKRLAICSLIIVGILVVWFVIFTVMELMGKSPIGERPGPIYLITTALLALSFAVFVLARSERLNAQQKLDVGLLF